MNDQQKLALMSAIRSLLIVIGGIAVTHGYLTDSMLNEIVGALITLATATWGVFDKLKGPQ